MKIVLFFFILILLIMIYLKHKSINLNETFKNKTKFGVMWANTSNIGDDFQALAAINLLKKNNIHDYVLVNREELSDYDGEPIVLIMNGWYMHDITKFPPSNKITPIFISVYVGKEELVRQNRDYFKKHEPIGCRDLSTQKLFEKYDIKAYFSGCLTLCFDEHKKKNDSVYIVDLNGCNGGNLKNSSIRLTTHYDNVKYIKHDFFKKKSEVNDINFRLKKAKELLDKYRKAKIILTSRLHVALPCRAFNTDVKFIHQNYYKDKRFYGLTSILNGGNKNIENLDSKIDRRVINKFKININRKFSELINRYKN